MYRSSNKGGYRKFASQMRHVRKNQPVEDTHEKEPPMAKKPTSEEALKPCPFCPDGKVMMGISKTPEPNGPPVYGFTFEHIREVACDCGARGTSFQHPKAEVATERAIKAWNRRTQ